MSRKDSPPLVAHVVHRLAVGGLENGVVNLINRLPVERFRHAVVCLTDATAFARRIRSPTCRSSSCTSSRATRWRSIAVSSRSSGGCDRRSCTRATSARSRRSSPPPRPRAGAHPRRARLGRRRSRRLELASRCCAASIRRWFTATSPCRHTSRLPARARRHRATRVVRICNGVDCERFLAHRRRAGREFPHAPFRDPSLMLLEPSAGSSPSRTS